MLYIAALGAYLTGLLLLLAIGLLPTVSRDSATVHSWMVAVAGRPGFCPGARGPGPWPMTMMVPDGGGTVAVQYLFSLLNLLLEPVLARRVGPDWYPASWLSPFWGTAATFNDPSQDVFDIVGQPPAI